MTTEELNIAMDILFDSLLALKADDDGSDVDGTIEKLTNAINGIAQWAEQNGVELQ